MHGRIAVLMALVLMSCGSDPSGTETDSDATTTSSTTGTTGATGSTAATTSEPTTGAATTGSTGTSTTGAESCPVEDSEIEVLLYEATGLLIVRPGILTCESANPGACDCIAEGIDRLFVNVPLMPGSYEVADMSGDASHVLCSKGDDGCQIASPGGTVTISSASASCVTGQIDFGELASGQFVVAPC
jgi:hypothetical protein